MASARASSVKPLLRTLLALAGCALALPAATLERLSLEDMIAKSTAIVRGKVLSSYAATDGPVIYTRYRVQVSETIKGTPSATVELQLPGGTANNMRQNFSGVPQFSAGDEFVFFLWTGKSGTTQILGLTQGLFAVGKDNLADPMMTRRASHEVMLDRTGKQVRDLTLTMRLSELRSKIGATLQGAGK